MVWVAEVAGWFCKLIEIFLLFIVSLNFNHSIFFTLNLLLLSLFFLNLHNFRLNHLNLTPFIITDFFLLILLNLLLFIYNFLQSIKPFLNRFSLPNFLHPLIHRRRFLIFFLKTVDNFLRITHWNFSEVIIHDVSGKCLIDIFNIFDILGFQADHF